MEQDSLLRELNTPPRTMIDELRPEIELLQELARLAQQSSSVDLSAGTLIRASQLVMAVWEAGLPLPELVPQPGNHLVLRWLGPDPGCSAQLAVYVSAHWLQFALVEVLPHSGVVTAVSKPGYRQDTASSVVDLVARYYQS